MGAIPGQQTYQRDPVSVLHDRGARELLARVYAVKRGTWVMTRLADPTDRHRRWAEANGWDLDGPDNAATLSGRHVDARTRWGRAFMRSLYYQHRWYGPEPGRGARGVRAERRTVPTGAALQVEWGRRLPGSKTGQVLPAGRAVRVRIAYGGKTARRVVERKAYADRIYTDDGDAGGRYSVAAGRDWVLAVSEIGAVVAVLASAVIVLTGAVALTRAVWRVAQDLRDNRAATLANTRAIDNLAGRMDGRLGTVEERLSALERGRPAHGRGR